MTTTAKTNYTSTIITMFCHQAKQNPNAIAFVHGNNNITFGAIDRQSDVLAKRLQSAGIVRQQMIPVFMQNCLEMMVSILAIFKAGAVYVPMDPDHPGDRISFMLDDLKATCVLVNTAANHTIFNQKQITLIEVNHADGVNNALLTTTGSQFNITPADNAYVIYTSGSTGKPKGVMVTHGALVNYLVNEQTQYINASKNVAGSFIHLSATFDASLTALFMPMIAGKFSVITTHQKAGVFTDDNLWKYAPYDFLKITPAHLDFLVPTFREKGAWLTQKIVIGGEALYPSHLELFAEQQVPLEIINEYGPTESTVGCTVFSFSINNLSAFTSEIPIGKPIDNTAVYLFEEKDSKLTLADKGELYIGGDSLAKGYLNNDQMTASKFIKNPLPDSPHSTLYKTGDIAKWLPDGNLAYIGRIDDQVKISGHRVELGEIESAINQMEEIANSCVLFKRKNGADLGRLVAYVVPRPYLLPGDGNKSIPPQLSVWLQQKIKTALSGQLPAYMVPGDIVIADQLPLTSNGKIDRLLLASLEIEATATSKNFVKPATSNEQKLAKIWEGLFLVNNIGATDDFFAMGGTSIQAARMFNLINKQLSVKLPLTTLIKAPTIQQLAAIIDKDKSTNGFSPIFAFNASGSQTPLFLLHAGGGDILFYKDLAAHLGSNQPVYGVIARGLDGKQLPLTSIEAMGQYYADEIIKVQPNGPFRIAGYCLGAIIGFEIVHILTKKGHNVEFLASINGVSPTYTHQPARPISEIFPINYGKGIAGKAAFHYKQLAGLGVTQIVKYPFQRLKRKLVLGYLNTAYQARLTLYNFYLARNKTMPLALARRFYFDTNTNMAARYQPKEYSGSLTIFRAPHLFPEKTLGWKNHVTGPITTIDIPGYHENRRVILYEPHVTLLAKKLTEELAQLPTKIIEVTI